MKNKKKFCLLAAFVAMSLVVASPVNAQTTGISDAERQKVANEIVANMVKIDGGTFKMGVDEAVDDKAWDDEKPQHEVTLSSFYLCKYEVTQRQWQAIMGKNPAYFKGENRPVECVSWDNCQEFIKRLNALTGRNFRLPTEAEWEYAARGGNKGRGFVYSGSKNIDGVAWYAKNSGAQSHDVGTREANELGLYDMTGNVQEWCSDWYGPYKDEAQADPQGPGNTNHKVYRGGSWNDNARFCRVSARDNWYAGPSGRFAFVGFRLAM